MRNFKPLQPKEHRTKYIHCTNTESEYCRKCPSQKATKLTLKQLVERALRRFFANTFRKFYENFPQNKLGTFSITVTYARPDNPLKEDSTIPWYFAELSGTVTGKNTREQLSTEICFTGTYIQRNTSSLS